MAFNDMNFMLNGPTAVKLYNEAAKDQPIFDYHCHLDPQEIYEDKPYDNIVDIWLGGDHYKWRLMRANGVQEKYITGDASKEEKFQAFAETVSKAFGNPLYHWSHMELKAVFGIEEAITPDNWQAIYEQANAYIQEHGVSPRQLIKDANVNFIGTTDHPLDDLEWHQKLKDEADFETVVAPTFRPDEAFVDHANFQTFTQALAEKTGVDITSFQSFVDAMEARIQFFQEMGCKAADISFGAVEYTEADEATLDSILQKALNGEAITSEEAKQWQTEIFVALNGLYKTYNFASQVHFGPMRNNNTPYSSQTGPDTGFDSMGDQTDLGKNLNAFLDRLSRDGKLPKMIWYPVNPTYNILVANTLQNYQANEEGIQSQLQFGSAWWFADTKLGMLDQMQALAEQGMLANFIGMLTDSRSFLSYQRHDYFRRILCSLVGDWVDKGEVPDNEALLYPFIEGICYSNAEAFFK